MTDQLKMICLQEETDQELQKCVLNRKQLLKYDLR